MKRCEFVECEAVAKDTYWYDDRTIFLCGPHRKIAPLLSHIPLKPEPESVSLIQRWINLIRG